MPHSAHTDSRGRSSRRLLAVKKHVARSWMPSNPRTHDRIAKRLGAGVYRNNNKALIEDCLKDFSIFSCFLYQLSKLQRKPSIDSLLACLRAHSESDVLSSLEQALKVTGQQNYDAIEPGQLEAMQHCYLAASTAKLMAPKFEANPSRAFLSTALRQLGELLIEFNYPSLMALRPEEQSPSEFASERLGFSPELLAASLLEGVAGVAWLQVVFPGALLSQEIASLKKLCEIGEALARSNAPSRYPSAEEDWKAVALKVQDSLGKTGLLKITEQTRAHLEQQLQDSSTLSACSDFKVAPSSSQKLYRQRQALRKNSDLSKLPYSVRSELEELYLESLPGQVNPRCLQQLLEKIIPKLGFSGGAVYLVDPTTMMLVPRAAIGNREIGEFRKIDYAPSIDNQDLVATAFRSGTRVSNTSSCSKLGLKAVTAAVIGTSKRAGVLYLEFPASFLQTQPELMSVAFKVILAALNHFFGLTPSQNSKQAGLRVH